MASRAKINLLGRILKRRSHSSEDLALGSGPKGDFIRHKGVEHPITPSHAEEIHRAMLFKKFHAEKVIKASHQKGMAKVGRHKADMKSRSTVNRKPSIPPALSKLAGMLKKRGYSTSSLALGAGPKGDFIRHNGVEHTISPSHAATIHKAMLTKKFAPKNSSSASAARKKAWITRKRKYGKSGGR
jgi:hypothetical protein